MKRGRPNIRTLVKEKILSILDRHQTHQTTSNLVNLITEETQRKVSWNTVQKYLQELVEAGRVQPMQLPHSKQENKLGLTVYTLKK